MAPRLLVPHASPALVRRCISARPRSRRAPLNVLALLTPAKGLSVTWEEHVDEVQIKVQVPSDVKGRDVKLEVHPKRLSLKLHGDVLLEGSLEDAGAVQAEDCFWVLDSSDAGKAVVITLSKPTSGLGSWPALLVLDKVDLSITDRAFLEVTIDGAPAGTVVIGLFGTVVPRTVANFKALAMGTAGESAESPLGFAASTFHRIIPGFMAQGGDITKGDGTGGMSLYGPAFEDENFKVRHEAAGFVSMANAGPNTNNSQFFITFKPTPHLDGKHVVFGKVEVGMEVVRRIEACGSQSGTPSKVVAIAKCGLLESPDEMEAIVAENSRITFA